MNIHIDSDFLFISAFLYSALAGLDLTSVFAINYVIGPSVAAASAASSEKLRKDGSTRS